MRWHVTHEMYESNGGDVVRIVKEDTCNETVCRPTPTSSDVSPRREPMYHCKPSTRCQVPAPSHILVYCGRGTQCPVIY